MMFSCLPPQGKCEWRHLQGFVQRFNSLYEKSYYRSQCLDVEIRDSPQPELLLDAPGEISIVVEHKSIVWPKHLLADHSNEHIFGDRIISLLNNAFNETAYNLTVNAESLHGKNKREVVKLGEQIANTILSNLTVAKLPRGVGNVSPIPWSFRPTLHSNEYPKSGVAVIYLAGFQTSWEFQEAAAAKAGLAGEFLRSANAAAEKFATYSDCLKLLLVQFYGDDWVVSDDDIAGIIQASKLPEAIDQVWLGLPEWISDDDCVVEWNLARGDNPY